MAFPLIRRARAVAQARRRRIRPPVEPPESLSELARAPADEAFITGNGIAARCRHVLNFDTLVVNEELENDWWFCKADFLEYFFAELAPRGEFVLFSHNSDRAIGRSFRLELRRRRLVAWLAQNPTFEHAKLRALPIGIANPRWPHGDQSAFQRVRAAAPPKTELVDVRFDPSTNPGERNYCLEQTGLEPSPACPFPEHLERLARAYFTLSPQGSGIDTHRTWEALYLRTVPIVTRSVLTEQHPDLPMIVLDDWSDFRSLELSPELYRLTWGDWSRDAIRLDRYFQRIEATIQTLRR